MIEQTTANETQLFDVDAFDRDQVGTANSQVTFALYNPSLPFSIDPSTGVLVIEGVLQAGLYDIVVVAEDNGSPRLSSNASFFVEVFPPNVYPPVFQLPFEFNVTENFASNSTPVHVFSVTDADPGDEGLVNMSLVSSGYASFFRLEVSNPDLSGAAEGRLFLETPFDRESIETFTLDLEATDNAHNLFRLNSSQTFNVTVLDANDNDPYFLFAPYAANVAEDATGGFVFFQVAADDDDIGTNAELTFSLGPDSDFNGTFSVDPSSGNVSVEGTLLKAIRDFYQLTIIVTDSGGLTNTTTLNVTVIEVNDNHPLINPDTPTNRTISEDTASGYQLIQVNVSDADTGVSGEYVLSLEQESTVFRLDGNILVLNRMVDIEVRIQNCMSLVDSCC